MPRLPQTSKTPPPWLWDEVGDICHAADYDLKHGDIVRLERTGDVGIVRGFRSYGDNIYLANVELLRDQKRVLVPVESITPIKPEHHD